MNLIKVMMLYPGFLKKAVTFSYDDGTMFDEKLIGIMRQNGLKATFNLVSACFDDKERFWKRCVKSEEELKRIYDVDGIEVATHCFSHPAPDRIPLSDVAWEILRDREYLEGVFDRQIRGFAYPYGGVNDDNARILSKCGIKYGRTVVSTHTFDLPQNPLKLNPTCHHDDPALFELAEKFINETPVPWADPWLFYIWGHAYEFHDNNNWDRIEKLASLLGGKEDIWYATNMEIVAYQEAFGRLVYSANGKRIHNPTALCIYLHIEMRSDHDEGKSIAIKPGETVDLETCFS